MALAHSDGSQQSWSSGFTFVLAAVGAAVGLGNIWKFPYIVGVSGGGAFVLVYVLCVVFIAIPILIAELWIGRRGNHSPPSAMRTVATAAGHSGAWSLVGWLGLAAGFMIASYYSVIAGWTLAYIVKAAGDFGGATGVDVANQFDELMADPVTMTVWHTVFMIGAMLIVARGLQGGIEKAVKFMMPALFVMMLIMIGYAAVEGDFQAATTFLFSTDFSKIDGRVVLTAIGQAFFSIGVAMGLIMAYGAYVPKEVSLTKSALIIAGADTLVAILAGLMIFPVVFAHGMDPGSGPGLVFKTLPTALAEMTGGTVFGPVFFILLAFAAVTSIIALLEGTVAYAQQGLGMSRKLACVVFGFVAWALGIATVLSFNEWSGVALLDNISAFEGKTPYDLIDYFTANLMMPLGGILIALFTGWGIRPEVLGEDLSFGGKALFTVWLWMIRIVAPLAIAWVLYSSI